MDAIIVRLKGDSARYEILIKTDKMYLTIELIQKIKHWFPEVDNLMIIM